MELNSGSSKEPPAHVLLPPSLTHTHTQAQWAGQGVGYGQRHKSQSVHDSRSLSWSRMTDNKQSQNLALIKELEYILDSCKLELTPIAEVWPNLYIGNVAIAQNIGALQKLGITHILNAAHSKQGSIGDQSYYGNTCLYCGIPAEDSSHFDISHYFQASADFIHKALKTKDGKVLVHCIMGMSRSATLVLAYLMLHRRITLRDALRHVIQRRAIYPNRNFLALLLNLDTQLTRKRRLCPLL